MIQILQKLIRFQSKHHRWYDWFNVTLQCANIGPADYNYDETISTLRYANRAKNIKNKARINEDPKDALLRQFQKEIEELKKKLEEGTTPQFHNVFMSELVSRMWLIVYGLNATELHSCLHRELASNCHMWGA